MRFSKILGATALFHITLSAAVLNQGHYYNRAELNKRVGPVIPKGGGRSGGGKGGDPSSGNPNSGKPAGANPDNGNPNSGTGASSPNSQDSEASSSSAASSRVIEVIQAAQADESLGMEVVLTDEEYQARGATALRMNKEAIEAKPRVDTTYNKLENSYKVTSLEAAAPEDGLTNGDTILKEIQLDPIDGWTFLDVISKKQDDRYKSTFVGYVSDDQRAIIATSSFSKYDTNTGTDRLPNSEIMFQLLQSKGDNPSKLEYVIRTPIGNVGSLQMMTRAVQAKFGPNSKLAQSYSFTSADDILLDGLVGDYWTAMNGLDNARPQSFMAADHPVALNGLKVAEIIVWPQLPSMESMGAMVVRMGR